MDTINEDFEVAKASLQNVNELADIKNNPVVESVLMPMIKAFPVIGDMIDSAINVGMVEFQNKKEQELVEIILKDKYTITSEMVNNVEFIMNFARTKEAVRRLATNDKVKYFVNLIRNGYLSGEHIDSNEFEEYLTILNTMSYREIQCLIAYKQFCDEKDKELKIENRWHQFVKDYKMPYDLDTESMYSLFQRIKNTGFIYESYASESGEVEDDTVEELVVEGQGFVISQIFNRFYDMVLIMHE